MKFMKKVVLLFVIIFFGKLTFAKEYIGSNANSLVFGSEKILTDDKTGSIKYIKLKNSKKVSVKNNIAWLNTLLNVSNSESFKLIKTESDQIGYTHYRYQLHLHGFLVEDAVFYIHSKNGYIISANGEYYPNLSVSSKSPSISISNAITIAKNSIEKNKGNWNDKVTTAPQLVIINSLNNGAFLTYKTDIYSQTPLVRKYIYVEASSGNIVNERNRIHHTDVVGTANTKYNGTKQITADSYSGSYRLRETGRGNGINTYDLNTSTSYGAAVDFTDSDNVWTTTTNQDDAAYDAHFGSEATYDYYFNNFGRNSYDNSGATINSYVHYDNGFVNAFWDGTQMTYGDGDGSSYTALTSIDVVGHEITHAVTENSAGLIYSYESGALNESFSDIFGIVIDFEENPSTANYLMGDQFSVSGTPFRSMSNPNIYGHPDTYNGTNWESGSVDNGGVHTNSGVQNYWFYLLTNGGSGTNDIGNSFSVSGIGMEAAAAISYRNLTTYLTANSQYSDARNYAIQSAIDLYGSCSAEVIATTNAWYAVGVGSVYSNSVLADFTADVTYSCSIPATITFTNNSINGTSYLWDFGDGNTSTTTNPTHNYTSAGVYTVTLITNGSASCGTNDTIIKTNYITITNGGGPISASCTPASTTPGTTGMGIFNFSFASINNASNGGLDGYQDYSCSNSTSVIEGNSYSVNITTGTTYNEDVRVWIDLNNDGQFNMTNELLFSSDNLMQNHTGNILIPGGTTLNTPLRLRVGSDYYANDFTTSCTDVTYGQYEDYTINVQANTTPPNVDFIADYTTVNIGQTVTFSDLSQNVPSAWSWEITGSNTPSSNLQNPTATYSSLGTYPVKLSASNTFGADSLTKTSYINVINSVNMCTGLDSTNATTGILFDSGGSSGNYADNENCSFLINPGCALDVTMSFSNFYSPTSSDYMRVYDGTDATATLIGNYTYMTTPPSSVTATSGSMYITWYSNSSSNYTGWEANWTSTTPTTDPIANFSISDNTPPLNVNVQFTDATTNLPNSWTWNFGDGNTSSQQNPTHSYANPGSYTVTLISNNCFALDTISYNVTVQGSPIINATPNPINTTVSCGDSITIPLSIYNTGSGDLIYEVQGGEVNYLDSSSQYYSVTGGNTSHNFINLPAYADSIYIEVTLNGDYTNYSSEYADLLIEGTNFGKINTSNTTDGINFIRQYAFGGTDVQNWFSDNQLTIVLDNSTGVHTGYGQQLNKVKISINGSGWLSLSQNSGNVPANDSTIINVNVNASNLFTGVYYDTLIVNSNDLTNNPLLIPIEFTVSGQPLISVTPNNINFGTLQVGASSTDTLYIDNLGCDTLDIASFTSSDISFSVASGGFKIPPFSNDTVIVTFAPDTIKTYSDTIFVNNNDSLAIVLVNGIGVGAPIISYNPTSITETIVSCNDSITIPVTVYNTGQGPLYTSININGVESGSTSNFFDGFEDGTYNNWTAAGTSSNFQVTNTNTATGSQCMKILGSTSNTLQYDFTPDTANYVSVKLRSDDISGSSNYFMLGNATYNYGICYIYHSGSNQYLITGNTTYSHTVPNSNDWTNFEIKNINYSAKTFDLFINGALVQSGIGFQNSSLTNISKIKLYNYDTFYGGYYDDILIGTGVHPDWIAINTDTLNTAISDSSLFNVTLYSEGLNSGTYNSSIILASNDPVSPFDTIPVSFTIDGTPEITLSDTCLNFGSIMENTSASDSLIIFNNGCDTLFITNITAGISEYSPDTTNLVILPNDSAIIQVTFSPTSVGTYNSFLSIYNNDSDTTICLTGSATGAPVISYNPTSISETITSCNDSITVPVTIYNTGGGPLYTSININGVSSGGASNFYDGFESGNINGWNTVGGSYTNIVTTSSPASGSYSLSMTGGATSHYNGIYNTFPTATPSSLSYKVKTTGSGITGLLVVGDNNLVSNSGLAMTYFSGSVFYFYTTSTGSITTNILANQWYLVEFKNIDYTTKTFDYYFDGALISSNVQFRSPTTNNLSMVHLYGWDAGQTSFFDDIQIGSSPSPQWISTDIDTLNTAITDSSLLSVTLYSEGLNSGIYNSNIILSSNDPLSPFDTIPVTFIVDGTPEITLSDTCLNFGSIMENTQSIDSFSVYNNGCDTLFITNVTAGISEYSPDTTNLVILPGDSTMIYVTFSPTNIGTFNSYLTIYNNDIDTTICLTGSATSAPVISTNPTSFNISLSACEDSITVPFTIYNSGGSDLVYNIPTFGSNALSLDSILQRLNNGYASITALVPNIYNFSDGITGVNISDGGNDMYDGGNYLNTNLFSSIPYSDNTIASHSAAGSSGSYFTRKNTGLFVFAADLDNVSTFSITGNLGADGNGSVDGTVLTSTINGKTYSGFVSRVFNAGDPSINHIIITEQAASLTQSYLTSTNNEDHILSGLTNTNRIYYLLYASTSGNYINDSETHAVMNEFLNTITTSDNSNVTPNNGTITPSDSIVVYATFYSAGLNGGAHYTEVLINSNDPINTQIMLPCTLNISYNPCSDFTFDIPNSCSGQTDFTDLTSNNPTSWSWNFGDGNSSSLQNPTNTYTSSGNYTVELISCNTTSCDTISYTVTITNTNGPINAFCAPSSTNSGSNGMGIFNFTFSTINNSTNGGSDGYQDYTCTNSATVTEGNSYSVNVTTGTGYNEDVRVWIDFDNDGQFNMTNELVFTSDNILVNHSGNIVIPTGGILSTPLRMRVGSDYYNNNFTNSCQNVMYGQYEDYTVIIQSNMQPPNSNFTYSILDQCQGIVQFTDISTNFPTSWIWNFGDGTSSTFQNPFHTFSSAGIYNVTLVATNAFGSSTVFNQTVTINSLNSGIQILSPQVLNQPINFNANAIGAISWNWTFGDGNSASIQSPTHTYTSAGTYVVTLVAMNGFGCSSTIHDTLNIYPVSVDEYQSQFMLYPNPNQGVIQVINKSPQNIKSIIIVNALGEYVYRFENKENYFNSQKIELMDVSTGIYFVKVLYENNKFITKKFLIQR
jgi:Zn-dependent metalloprotease